MSLILYINGQVADLAPGTVIAQTRQVNDLNSIDNRQAGYTNTFSLPKTAVNIRIMNGLTLTGNNSTVPYVKNECSLYGSSGVCFVYNGWAVVTDGGDSYDVVIYDGVIDLYKAIEGQNLAVITGLSDLNHEKNVTTIRNSWQTEGYHPYRYILADYNGQTMYNNSTAVVEADYLAPSVNVAWLWDKIFSHYNIAYEGSIFQTQHFKNLWMTYPKGLSGDESSSEAFNSDTITYQNAPATTQGTSGSWRTLLCKLRQPSVYDTADVTHAAVSPHLVGIKTAGYYKVTVTGNHKATTGAQIGLYKNLPAAADAATLNTLWPSYHFAYDQPAGQDFTFSTYPMVFAEGDTLTLGFRHKYGPQYNLGFSNTAELWENLELSVEHISLGTADFTSAFAEFPVKDFLTEIVHRFGLTLHKDKHTSRYTFSTLAELMQNPDVADWSGKFIRKKEENYIYGSYAQQNWFRHLYNETGASYNDGVIAVPNVNLTETRDVIKSKIYSPEQVKTSYLGRPANVYKLYEKEITKDDDGTAVTNYKPLDKRYYFLRAMPAENPVNINSATLGGGTSGTPFMESYWKLSYSDVVRDFYEPLSRIMDRAQIVSAELWLSEADVADADFSRLHYIEQLGGYFILNKIDKYIPGKPTACELVRVVYGEPQLTIRSLELVSMQQANVNSTTKRQTFNYIQSYPGAYPAVQVRDFAENEPTPWSDSPSPGGIYDNGTLIRNYSAYQPGHLYYFRLYDAEYDIYSNEMLMAFL